VCRGRCSHVRDLTEKNTYVSVFVLALRVFRAGPPNVRPATVSRIVASSDCHFPSVVAVSGVSSLPWSSCIEKMWSLSKSKLVVGVVGGPINFSSSRSSSMGVPSTGSRDSKSGASFCFPGTCTVLKSKLVSCSDQRVNFEFLSLALCNHVSAELSVRSSKRRVSRYGRNFSIAQIIAKHSRSTAAYRVCVSLNFLLA